MKKIFLFLLLALAPLFCSAQRLSDEAAIHLITCTAGQETWSKYGHTAIRVIDPANDIDIVFNYGIFSLQEKGFYLKFVRGETYYQLGIESWQQFLRFYGSIGRHIYWQHLNLTHDQKQQIWDALVTNYQPENRYYLYNFVFDNCATRPYYILKHALGDTILSSYQGREGTPFRQAVSYYTGRYNWVDFGINMVFGSEADAPMSSEQRLFLPEELMYFISEASLPNGQALVLDQDIAPFAKPQVPWYADCRFGIALFALFLVLLSLWDRKRGRLSLWVDILFIIFYLILAFISVYLTFFSIHPLVGFNLRLLLLPFLHLCARTVYFLR